MSFLPEQDIRYLSDRGLDFEEATDRSQRAVIVKSHQLPEGHYDVKEADIMILLPSRYPMVPPDMFYLEPWVRLVGKNAYPKAAGVSFPFVGKNWQRWSRHNREWRPGKDGIWTMMKRVEHALAVAS